MLLEAPRSPLRPAELPEPQPRPGQVLIRVHACGVCRTDLHVVDGELPDPKLPLVVGHQIVGTVERGGERFVPGTRVGVPWLGWTDGDLPLLPLRPREPVRRGPLHRLPPRRRLRRARRSRTSASASPFPERLPGSPGRAAALRRPDRLPLAADGGRRRAARALRLRRLRAHRRPGRDAPGTARSSRSPAPATTRRQAFARALGADWAGVVRRRRRPSRSTRRSSSPRSARSCRPRWPRRARGGIVVCAGIHMSDIPSFPYELLWGERSLRSVANLTRRDGEEFLALAPRVPVRTTVRRVPARGGERGARRPARRALRGLGRPQRRFFLTTSCASIPRARWSAIEHQST